MIDASRGVNFLQFTANEGPNKGIGCIMEPIGDFGFNLNVAGPMRGRENVSGQHGSSESLFHEPSKMKPGVSDLQSRLSMEETANVSHHDL